jgi:peptide-methionine (S)-S-oxide reductase
MMNADNPKLEKAYFAAGCFWHVEDAFRHVPGVVATAVGFMGGRTENPSYKEVCTDQTGHAETTEVVYDPTKVTYDQLLEVFWSHHDPTTMNRQGPDFGSQYRSAIFYLNKEQEEKARASKENLQKSGKFAKPIVTEIVPVKTFYKAEEYHQQYFEKTGQRSCGI